MFFLKRKNSVGWDTSKTYETVTELQVANRSGIFHCLAVEEDFVRIYNGRKRLSLRELHDLGCLD